MEQTSLSILIYGIIFLACVTQWVFIKLFLYKKFHFVEKNINPRRLEEKDKIKQKSLVLFFIPLIFILLMLENIPSENMIFLSTFFLILFFVCYWFLNRA